MYAGEPPMVMQVVVTGARNEPEGPVMSGFPGLGGETFLQGLVRLHNPSRENMKTILQVTITLKGTTFSRSPNSSQTHTIPILELSQTPLSRASETGGLVLVPTSIRDIPFRIDIPQNIAASLPPSIEHRVGSTPLAKFESGTRYELTVTVQGLGTDIQTRTLRIRVPHFPTPQILAFSAERATRHEGVSPSSTVAYSMSHPSIIIPGRVFPFEFRLAFPGDKNRKYSNRLQKVRFEIIQRVKLIGANDEEWVGEEVSLSWGRLVTGVGSEQWSVGVHGPAFTDKAFLKTPNWLFPTSQLPSATTPRAPLLSILPSTQTPCIQISHFSRITVVINKQDDMIFEKEVTILPCTPTMMEELTGEWPWLIIEAAERAARDEAAGGSGSGGGGGGGGGGVGGRSGGAIENMDEDEMMRRAIEASMAETTSPRGGGGGDGGSGGGGGPSTLPEDKEEDDLRKAILASLAGEGGAEDMADELRSLALETASSTAAPDDDTPSRSATFSSSRSAFSDARSTAFSDARSTAFSEAMSAWSDVRRKQTTSSQTSSGSSPRLHPTPVQQSLASPHLAPTILAPHLPITIPDILPPAYADVIGQMGLSDPPTGSIVNPVLPQEDNKRPRLPVIHAYMPLRDDELEVNLGDVIEVLESFEDGWVLGVKVGTDEKGFVPGNSLGEVYGGQIEITPPSDHTSSPNETSEKPTAENVIPTIIAPVEPNVGESVPGYSATPLQEAEGELERLLANGEVSGMEFLKRRDILRAAWREVNGVVGGGGVVGVGGGVFGKEG